MNRGGVGEAISPVVAIVCHLWYTPYMDEVETAWAAGLFEGEGSATLRRSGTSAVLMLSMTDQDVVVRFAEWAGVGSVTERRRGQPHHKDQWTWQVGGWADVVDVIDRLLPFMGQRRSERLTEVRAGVWRDSRYCKRGKGPHLVAEVGTVTNGKGTSTCAGCQQDRWARGQARRKRTAPSNETT